jgi:glycosyltransferase involved in cell wall biosynthesis
MAELITDGVTGLLSEPGNAQDLAEKIRWAEENPSKMRDMGRNARREYLRAYTPQRNFSQLMAIYRSVLAEH